MTAEDIAIDATMHSFLNCYLRETDDHEVVRAAESPIDADTDRVVHARLPTQGVELFVPLAYESPTGRHLYDLPASYRLPGGDLQDLRYTTLVDLVTTDLSGRREDAAGDELMLRVIKSKQNIERFVAARRDDDRRTAVDLSFRDAEQSLVFGHHLHPTPKSRQGIPPHKGPSYAPELRGGFPLHYFAADPDIVAHESTREQSAPEWIAAVLREDDAVPESVVTQHLGGDSVLLPVHPWQADYLREQDHVQQHLGEDLHDLGQFGPAFYPTTSVRTLYNPDAPFMIKTSLAVKITNSKRTNKRPELERGVAIDELFDTELGDALAHRYPNFAVIRDPAYLTVDIGADAESGFETVLRENPFRDEAAENVTPVVALCQDGIDDEPSRLERIIRTLADREDRSTADVSEDWFQQYLDLSIEPLLWLYLERGLGLEAHQQNSVLELDSGYPDAFYYRDNQGFYFPESVYEDLDALLPGVGERADTICPDSVADERIRYYVLLNNAFGVINAFGTAGLIDERRLLGLLREKLESLEAHDRASSSLLDGVLSESSIPCKANLLTRFHDMDELVGSLANQSVYVDIENPLVTELEVPRL